MKKKLYSGLILLLLVSVSILIMFAPSFFSKGVSRISINKTFDLELILNNTKNIELVFFGYSGCSDICTPRLFLINDLYASLNEKAKEQVGIIFLDISTPFDKELPQRFAAYFNKDFIGIHLNKKILRAYTKTFDVYFSKSLLDQTEYNHTSNLYLVKKTKGKKEIKYVYNSYPYDIKQIKNDIKELIYEQQ